MKRSKALANIRLEIVSWMCDHQIEGINLGQVDELNTRILNMLEHKLGMLPPKRYYQNNKNCEIGNEWSPEDET